MSAYGDEILEKLAVICSRQGLRFFGVAGLGPEQDFSRFDAWLEHKAHAGMSYLEKYKHCRADPRELLVGAKTAVVVGLPYGLGDRYRSKKRPPARPRIAQYARLKDYHRVIWDRGEHVYEELVATLGADPATHAARVVVDSAPVLERALAARGGRGFIGKNTCFIDPAAGSFFLLGEIITTLALPVFAGETVDPTRRTAAGGCGTCQRCQIHCPTGALDRAYSLDANKCLSYWTIENRGPIPEKYWPWLAHYLYGCDICQLVCPYNRPKDDALAASAAPPELLKVKQTPPLFNIATMTNFDYEKMFGGTPMTRAKREGLMRNALIAMCVTGDPRLPEALAVIDVHETAPVLRETRMQISTWLAGSNADSSHKGNPESWG
jgi:epoxyqueuosine reductase